MLPELINPENLYLTNIQFDALMPILILTAGILISMLLATVKIQGFKTNILVFSFTVFTLAFSLLWMFTNWVHEPVSIFSNILTIDYFSCFFSVLIFAATLLTVISSFSYLERINIHYSEFYPLILTATLGMILLVSATELLTLFVSLELMSLTVYILVGIRRKISISNEAAIKYFITGSVASAVLLYGIAMIYGALNATKISEISAFLAQQGSEHVWSNPTLLLGFVLLVVGFLFKIAVAPFHMWTPDVYEGAPTNITSYMATALKAAVFASLIRIMDGMVGNQGVSLIGDLGETFYNILWVLALLTMVVGNFIALMQSNFKRLMAYSAIAHTGYLLVGILTGPMAGYSGVLFYLVAYTAMNIGVFIVISLVNLKEEVKISDLRGFGKKNPVTAGILTLFLLSLSGIPPTAGFVAKYFLFTKAIEADEVLLSLAAVITSVVSVYYYLRIVVIMYMSEESCEVEVLKSPLAYAALAVCVFLTINYGIFPGGLIHAAQKAVVF